MSTLWTPSQRYPDPAVVSVTPEFDQYRLPLAKIERLSTGHRWCEGPVWVGEFRSLVWSDVPGNAQYCWDEQSGSTRLFRAPSNHANGNTRDRQGRLITCEHLTRQLVRTELDGQRTVLASDYQGASLNSPNDVVCHSDGSIWFTDPVFGISGFYEGEKAEPALSPNLYRLAVDGTLSVMSDSINQPNGLAFSPDESILYVVQSRGTPRQILAFDVVNGAELTRERVLIDAGERGTPDGFRVDIHGNLWCGWGMGEAGLDGVHVFNPDGELIGRIDLPERCANLCFGGLHRNRLFMAASTSVYSLYVNTQGVAGG
ncbi:SMP-30/gluconolactonase/LRE family protein [Granulosicoccus sp. 3-233]|uniref:SMP-30/gluconolactonase/LRE family protein n=1 Tax=Granulosicoccus sp. 3-233 TaxID=3417969 RepID=UPI003D33240B